MASVSKNNNKVVALLFLNHDLIKYDILMRSSVNVTCDFNLVSQLVCQNHLRKIRPERIRHILSESKPVVIGIAIKNGIDRTKNVVESSSDAHSTYAARTNVQNGTTPRGINPATTSPITTKCAKNTTFIGENHAHLFFLSFCDII